MNEPPLLRHRPDRDLPLNGSDRIGAGPGRFASRRNCGCAVAYLHRTADRITTPKAGTQQASFELDSHVKNLSARAEGTTRARTSAKQGVVAALRCWRCSFVGKHGPLLLFVGRLWRRASDRAPCLVYRGALKEPTQGAGEPRNRTTVPDRHSADDPFPARRLLRRPSWRMPASTSPADEQRQPFQLRQDARIGKSLPTRRSPSDPGFSPRAGYPLPST